MLAADLARALDPALLACAGGLTPDPWQAALLRSRARQMLLLCSRQAGKSQASGWLAVDEAVHGAPALVLLLAPALRQSQELFRKTKEILRSLGPSAAPIAQESALSLDSSFHVLGSMPGITSTQPCSAAFSGSTECPATQRGGPCRRP